MKPRIAKTGAVFWACTGGNVRGVARSPAESYKVWADNVARFGWPTSANAARIQHADRKLAYGIVGTP